MKCDDDSGCPFAGGFDGCGVMKERCHITPADFPLLNAMIAGTCACKTCANLTGFCSLWQPKGGDERERL